MAKVITVKLGLDADEALGVLGGVNKQLRSAFTVPTTQLNVVRGLFKNLQDNTTYTKKQFDSLVNKSTAIVGNSVLSSPNKVSTGIVNTYLGTIKTKFNQINTDLDAEIAKILTASPKSISKNQINLLTDWKTNLNSAIDSYVPVPKGLNLKNASWANNLNPLVGDANILRTQETTLNNLLNIDKELDKNGRKFQIPYLDRTQAQHFYNSLTNKNNGVFKVLDDEYDRLVKSQAYNKRNADAYLASSNAELSYIQEYLTARGISNLDITRSTNQEFKDAKRAAGITDTADIDELFKRATLTRERQNTLNSRLKSVQDIRNNQLIKDLKDYKNFAISHHKTADLKDIETHNTNLQNIRSTKAEILKELNNYKLGLSNDYTNEQFKSAVEEFKQRDDADKKETRRIQYLGAAYNRAREAEGQTLSAIDTSEKLVGENITAENIDNINKRFSNLNQTFNDLKNNKEYQRVTGKKNFLENIFGKNSKISNNYKEQLTDLRNKQDNKLKELASLAERNYGLKLYGDYSEANFKSAFLEAFRNSQARGETFTPESIRNLGQIGKSIKETNTQRTTVNNILTANQQQREEEREEEQKRQQTITNLNAFSQATRRLGDMAWQGTMYGKGSVDEYVKYQSSVVGIAKLLPALRDKNTLIVNDKFKEFREGILELTNRLPSSGIELAHSAEVAARLGVTDPDRILDMVDLSSKLGATFGMAPDDVTQQVVKIANAKGYDFSDPNIKQKILDNVADPINYLDDHTAASGREILNFTKKSASIGEQVGMSTKDVAAFGATLISLGITSDSAATAFKNLITVMQTGARNQKKGREYLEKAGFTQQELMEGIKKAPTATALKFLTQLNKLKSGKAGEDAASIARFGFGQMSLPGILALVNNPDRLQQYIEMANSGAKNWTEIEYKAKEVNDPAIRFATMQNKYKELQITLGEALMPLADDLITTFKDMAQTVKPLIKENKDLIKNTMAVTAGTAVTAKGLSMGADLAILWNQLNLGKHLGNLGTFLTSAGLPLLKGGASTTMLESILAGALSFGGGLWAGTQIRNNVDWLNTDVRVDRENKEEDKARNKARGDIKTAIRRNRGEHGDVFKKKRRDELIRQFQNEKFEYKAGFKSDSPLNIFRDENGKYKVKKRQHYGWDKNGKNTYRWIDVDNLTKEQEQLLNEIERLDIQLKGERKRNNVAPKGEIRENKYGRKIVVDPTTGKRLPVSTGNIIDYNNYVAELERTRNIRTEKASKTWTAKEHIKKAKTAYDFVEGKKELLTAEREEREFKQHEKGLIEYGKQIDWTKKNATKEYEAYRKAQAAKTPEQLKEEERIKRQQDYLASVKALGFESTEQYELSMQQKKVEYLQKEYQALKDLAGEGSNPALKDLNAYFNKDINPYGYYGIERVGEQLEQAKQKLKEIEELANKVDFSKMIEKAGENFGKDSLKYFVPFSELFNMPEDKIGNLEKTSSTVNIIKTNTNNIKTVMPDVISNFNSLGSIDLSNLLATTSGIASNLKAIKETGNISINLDFNIKKEEYNKQK